MMSKVIIPKIVGHRGVGKEGLAPENTLRSFVLCMERNIPYIETDLRVCKTGEIVLFHGTPEGTIPFYKDGTSRIGDLSLEELKRLDVGGGHTIPSLEELFVAIEEQKFNLKLNLELKGEEWKRKESGDHQRLLLLVEKYHMQERVDYCSFHHEALAHLKALCPDVKITYLFNYMGQPTPLDFVEQACYGDANGVSMLFHYLTKEQVCTAHEKGLSVTVWMPWIFDDSEEDWKKCLELQVDLICSNYPFGLMNFLSNISE
ncbi:glycerophosphodiester phosphodiesterase [Galdieria sulphuraria]|uniref:Glycerophosphodiester phosphodiesterase n=1 Tax=Galdieria sulphuraria TaxID=130081 RepID=M2Y2H0_GALSU|nr:glycerophosphodiester phosphodiesterase [Galdieria sulphuraria]EME30153.1 glycerophosphodiester phosphodiesterase [Galdieria sulphuraria]|eukprot:XP_005706673.1 glycerophosphodiester phosphodiesterase [Galdieria sulphuraria]